MFDWKKPTVQMLGRWQPWHDGHQELFKRCIKKTGQVIIQVRDVQGTNDKNPFDWDTVCKNIEEGLSKLGISYKSSDDSIVIMGNRDLNISKEVNIDSFGDHRIAMSFLIAGLRFDSEVHVNDCKNIDTSFPSFFETFSSLGADIKTI